jgi:hypothetical protein
MMIAALSQESRPSTIVIDLVSKSILGAACTICYLKENGNLKSNDSVNLSTGWVFG